MRPLWKCETSRSVAEEGSSRFGSILTYESHGCSRDRSGPVRSPEPVRSPPGARPEPCSLQTSLRKKLRPATSEVASLHGGGNRTSLVNFCALSSFQETPRCPVKMVHASMSDVCLLGHIGPQPTELRPFPNSAKCLPSQVKCRKRPL